MNIKINGIDVSFCQRGLDWNKVKTSGAKFAIIRAGRTSLDTAGDYVKDTECDYHVSGAESIKIPYGFYWYSYAESVKGAIQDAKNCIEVIKKYNPRYPIYWDMEESSQAALGKDVCTEMALAFCDEISKSGYTAGIYTNPSWLSYYYISKKLIGVYDIWLAHWTNSPDVPTSYTYGQKIWQWGTVKIGKLSVDADISYCDYTDMDISESKPAELDGYKVGDKVKITGKYAGGANSIVGAIHRAAIGWERYIVAIYPNSKYPYLLGDTVGNLSASHTTGFARKKAIKKVAKK